MKYNRKILKINLTNHSTEIISPEKKIYEYYLGGRGLATFFLKDILLKSEKEEKPLLFFPGCLTGSNLTGENMLAIMSVSPINNRINHLSALTNSAKNIKMAGFDGIIITGKSNYKCKIIIKNESVDFINIENKANCNIEKNLPSGFANIYTGQSADKNILFSGIILDGECKDSNGIGYIFNSKNLKSISIKGTKEIQIPENENFKKFSDDIERLVNASPALKGESGFSNFGSGAIYDLLISRRMIPTNNFKNTFFPDGYRVNTWNIKKRYGIKNITTFHPENRFYTFNNQPVPFFEELVSLSSQIENLDIDIIINSLSKINSYGLNIIETNSVFMFLKEKGHYSNTQYIKFLDDLINGNLNEFNKGILNFFKETNSDASALAVNGIMLPPLDPRGAYGTALSYCTSNTGASHTSAMAFNHEILRKPVATDRFSFFGKAGIIKSNENNCAVMDSLGISKYMLLTASLEEYAKIYNLTFSTNLSVLDLNKIADNIYYNEITINNILNKDINNDILPELFFNEPGSSGDDLTIPPINKNEFLNTLKKYYLLRGLNPEGKPEIL